MKKIYSIAAAMLIAMAATAQTDKKCDNACANDSIVADTIVVYTLKTGKVGEAVVEGYKKIENGVVVGYKKIENGVVEGCRMGTNRRSFVPYSLMKGTGMEINCYKSLRYKK